MFQRKWKHQEVALLLAMTFLKEIKAMFKKGYGGIGIQVPWVMFSYKTGIILRVNLN